MDYYPDRWKIIKLSPANGDKPHYRVFASWRGGFAQGDSWKMNSGITKVEKDSDLWLFHGSSGSVYYCHAEGYGSTLYGESILGSYIKESHKPDSEVSIQELPEETDWLELEFSL